MFRRPRRRLSLVPTIAAVALFGSQVAFDASTGAATTAVSSAPTVRAMQAAASIVDLSGTWVSDLQPSDRGLRSAPRGARMTIRKDAASITLGPDGRFRGGLHGRFFGTYKLDGSENTNADPLDGEAKLPMPARVSRLSPTPNGVEIVVVRFTGPGSDRKNLDRHRVTLEMKGDALIQVMTSIPNTASSRERSVSYAWKRESANAATGVVRSVTTPSTAGAALAGKWLTDPARNSSDEYARTLRDAAVTISFSGNTVTLEGTPGDSPYLRAWGSYMLDGSVSTNSNQVSRTRKVMRSSVAIYDGTTLTITDSRPTTQRWTFKVEEGYLVEQIVNTQRPDSSVFTYRWKRSP